MSKGRYILTFACTATLAAQALLSLAWRRNEYSICACQGHRLFISAVWLSHASSSRASSRSSVLMLPVDGSCNLITISPAHDSMGFSLHAWRAAVRGYLSK